MLTYRSPLRTNTDELVDLLIMYQVNDLRRCCEYYRDQLPIAESKQAEFIRYCYQTGEFHSMKFAMMLDNTLLNISLVDENLAIRELAQTVKKYEHGRGNVKTY